MTEIAGADPEAVARRLREAYAAGPIPPLRDGLDATDAEAAYRIQSINTRYWRDRGRRVIGRKIGLTAKAVQAQLGVDQPDFGILFADMAIEDGGILMPTAVIQPKAEAEVALVLERDIDNPAATVTDVIRATACALPAIEIVDSRIADWKITFADTVADNGSSAFFVLGRTPRTLAGLDLRTCGMVLEVDGRIASLGAGAACLGHPLTAAAWLARALSATEDHLKAGDIILTGALGPMVPIKPGDRIATSIGGLGHCAFDFAPTGG
ncbi:2-keto-4-pentenoate hydratase [Zavarzinia sp.]|uniref:2-keto-4-pentenoate hydratase n=1 Tax=Zavarzinia sp. TaxID=2027920 RepID=UPI003BB7C554|nr:fumarylacetoacetate hydrolase family protein [Zavarzinia sp.]